LQRPLELRGKIVINDESTSSRAALAALLARPGRAVDREGPCARFALEDAVGLVEPIAGALARHHARARSAALSTVAGAAYRAPEEVCGAYGVVGPWTDVFVLGRLLLMLVSGREPLATVSVRPVAWPAHARIPPVARAVLDRALSIYPVERWQTAPSFWSALETGLERFSRSLER
jgi:hypothetical protein